MTDNNPTIGLSRRKLLGGLGAIGVASAGAGLGTTAYFSDQESFEGNTITAGELDLSVTWQQLYQGAPQSTRPGDYGTAMRPFVNAYPDHDGNGLQSFEREDEDDNLEFHQYAELTGDEDDDEREAEATAGRNLEFACDEIATFDDVDFGTRPDGEPQKSLIELDDVKPGDCGEITFGLKLCDNPGYIWLHGGLTSESDGGHSESGGPELADEIVAKAWYDDGDNVYQEGEPIIVSGTLRDVLTQLNDGQLLAFEPEGGSNGSTTDSPTVSGRVTVDTDEIDERIITSDDHRFGGNRNYDCDDYEERLERFAEGDLNGAELFKDDFEVGDSAFGCATITVDDRTDDGTVTLSSDGPVIIVSVKGGNQGENVYVFDEPVVLDGATFSTPSGQDISNIDVCCLVDGETPPPENGDICFQPSTTRFIGFEWCLPTTVGNEVQGDSLSFDLSFYTEQCRHNPDPENPFAGTAETS